jgi:hypothetical protein
MPIVLTSSDANLIDAIVAAPRLSEWITGQGRLFLAKKKNTRGA